MNLLVGFLATVLTAVGRYSIRTQILCGLVVLGLFLGAASQARSDFMYWTDAKGIERANLDGTGQTTLVKGAGGNFGIALDLAAGEMYWTRMGDGTILRANLDGTGQTPLVTGLHGPAGIALDVAGGKMYWTSFPSNGTGDIRQANLDGSGQTTIITGLPASRGIALDVAGGKMYWTDAAFSSQAVIRKPTSTAPG